MMSEVEEVPLTAEWEVIELAQKGLEQEWESFTRNQIRMLEA